MASKYTRPGTCPFSPRTLGFDSGIELGVPESETAAGRVDTVLKWAQDAGMETGESQNKWPKRASLCLDIFHNWWSVG